MTRLQIHTRLVGVIALTLSTSTLVACATWKTSVPTPTPAGSVALSKATVVNHHHHAIMVSVSAVGTEWRLGTIGKGGQRTFELPAEVSRSISYYLLADCWSGERIVSERIATVAARRPHFMVGPNSLTSYVRLLRSPWTTAHAWQPK